MSTNKLDLDALVLDEGAHSNPDEGMCVMEAVAYIAGEPFSDHPKCASPVIGAFLRSWNDSLDDEQRQILKPYVPQVVGTNTGNADDETRGWMATDWLVREFTPGMLRLAGLTEQAELLEQLEALTDRESAERAQPAIDEARANAAAANAAAAWDVAGHVAWHAAWAAAAKPLVFAKFAEVTPGLQKSALLLLERMIQVGREDPAAA